MNKLVVSLSFGIFDDISKISFPLMKQYAERIGADFRCIVPNTNAIAPNLNKSQIKDLLETYDRVVYLDCDTLVRPDCPDLFDIVPYGWMGMYDEGSALPKDKLDVRWWFMDQYAGAFGYTLPAHVDSYFNAGVMVADKTHAELFSLPPVTDPRYIASDQTCMNIRIVMDKPRMFHLPVCFNQMCFNAPKNQYLCSFIVHFAGYEKDERLKMMGDCISQWKDWPVPSLEVARKHKIFLRPTHRKAE
jgi:hypothetical protein